jgi:hypothetical protein
MLKLALVQQDDRNGFYFLLDHIPCIIGSVPQAYLSLCLRQRIDVFPSSSVPLASSIATGFRINSLSPPRSFAGHRLLH